MGTRLFLSIFVCLVLISCVVCYPSKSDSDSDEDALQQQQQQNVDLESLEQFTQKIQSVKGRRRKPEKTQQAEFIPEPEQYDPCLDSRKSGPCKAHIPRYFFNKASGNCELFPWGGCSKNGNNFRDLTDCENVCSKHVEKGKLDVPPTPDRSAVIENCEKPPVPESSFGCLAYIPRWTYNATEQKCEEFIWGGCPKTENNFPTEGLCQATCGDYPKFKGLIEDDTTEHPEATTQTPGYQQHIDIGQAKNICSLPSDPGMCMAMFEKYFFNERNNRCELFTYGGCGGNKNRFDTAQDCVRTCGGDKPNSDVQCADVECPWALYDHYTSLGCSPIYDGEACCPTRYECSDQRQDIVNNTLDSRSLTWETTTLSPTEEDNNGEITASPKCRYRGKLYAVGEKVDEASDTGSCRTGCFCADGGPNAEYGPSIICAQIECPEHFTGRPEGKENCIPLYKKGDCCSYDYHCPEGELAVIQPGQKPSDKTPQLAKCEVNGEAYFEGQRVYPDKSPCSKCLCQRNPNNATSLEGQLYCEKVDCGIEIYYSTYLARGCAPVYYEKDDGTTSCCPISWECPDDKQQESENGEEDTNTTPGTLLPEPPKPPSTDSPLPPSPPSPDTDTDKPSSPLVRTREACRMEKQEGNCKGHRPRYFFNEITGKCETFIYTGCKGNLNNFASLEDCKELCESSSPLTQPSPPAKGGKTVGGPGLLGRSRSIDANPSSGSQQETKAISLTEVDPCTLPRKVGRCKGYFPRFYYSPEDHECKLFIFGGCRPNANNFYSKDSCEATCLNKIPVENLKTNVPAALAIPTKNWRSLNEGGDASKVNFGEERPRIELRSRRPPPTPPPKKQGSSSEEENACELAPRTGRCKAFVRRFYYDTDKKMCKSFTYGGCSGNANNFHTVEECNEKCITNKMEQTTPTSVSGASGDNSGARNPLPPSASLTLRCKLPKAAGSCHNSIRSYYYDVETKSCKLFFFSGCFGNANRFSSREDCENLCKKPLDSEGSRNEEQDKPRIHILREGDSSSEDSEEKNNNPSSTPSSAEVGETSEKDFCKQDPVSGNCNEKQLRFYYDSSAKQCLPFVYSGCSGNQNNFITESECMSSCGNKPTLEQLAEEMVLTCTFGNKTVPLGATVGANGKGEEYSGDEIPCGKPVCQCITPPAVTCVQRMCPEPTTTTTEKICPMVSCLSFCKVATGLDGCPTCDCDYSKREEDVIVKGPGPSKGAGVKG